MAKYLKQTFTALKKLNVQNRQSITNKKNYQMKRSYFVTTMRKSALQVLFIASILMLLTSAGAARSREASVSGAQPKAAAVPQGFNLSSIPGIRLNVAAASQINISCTPIVVGVFEERVHVECANPIAGPIRFYAISTTSAGRSGRFLSAFTAAYVSGRPLTITVNLADTSGASFGCSNADCRIALAPLL
jgi:hypothetical protein